MHSVSRCLTRRSLCPAKVCHSTRSHGSAPLSLDSILSVRENMCLVSTSCDIYANLALEHWIYERSVFSPAVCLLLMWRDTPCVVIGRHQNPWTEVHVRSCDRAGIAIARRHSGGGTVYHDMGNINLSFLTSRADYSRPKNLNIISKFLHQEYGIDSEISVREDLVTKEGKLKVSGTASKLALVNAYHHCTLLVNADLINMRTAIRKTLPAVTMSRATASIRSEVTNLSRLVSGLSAETIMTQIARQHCHTVHHVSPDDPMFESLSDSRLKLSDWDWVYGRTPRFTAEIEYSDSLEPLILTISANNGRIEEAIVKTDGRQIDDLMLTGCKFTQSEVQERLLDWSLAQNDHLLTINVCKAADKLFESVT